MKKELSLPIKNPKEREISPFMAKQLLYDFATKKIDPLREKALTEALDKSTELSKALDDIVYGMTYCHHIQKATISPEFLDRFKAPPSFFSQLKRFRNSRNWSPSTIWIIEAVVIVAAVLLLSLAIPWPEYVKTFIDKQAPWILLSETPKDKSYEPRVHPENQPMIMSSVDYNTVGNLLVVNPEFTTNKLMTLVPRLGASIEHQALRKSSHGEIDPYFKISVPSHQFENLILELKSQGLLTWITPPPENREGSRIFGLELWIYKQEPQKGQAPPRDSTGE